MNLIFAVPIILAMLRELDGHAIETSEEANEKIGLHEISDRGCPPTGCVRGCRDFRYTYPCSEWDIERKIQCSHYLKSGHRCDFTCSKNENPGENKFLENELVWTLVENQAQPCVMLNDLGILY